MYTPTAAFKPGDTLDSFRLDRVVAASGMATVFEAHRLEDGERIAIKVPHPEVESDPVLWERFQREEEIGISLDHPGVMKVYANPGRTQVYMVMAWLEGRLLRQVLNEYKTRAEAMPLERAVRLTIAVCRALEHVHANGVVHRDLKPENIMVDEADRICLIDFGIAGSAAARRLTFAHFSQSLGTPDYISPEQVRGKRGDAHSDVYALGVILYEMLTGAVPFTGPSPLAVMNDRLLNSPPPPRTLRREITPQLQEIIYRALERNPKNRYASVREMARDLEHQEEVGVQERTVELKQWMRRRSPLRPRVLLIVGATLIPVLLFVLLLLVARRQ